VLERVLRALRLPPRGNSWLTSMVRLNNGVSMTQAQAEFDALARAGFVAILPAFDLLAFFFESFATAEAAHPNASTNALEFMPRGLGLVSRNKVQVWAGSAPRRDSHCVRSCQEVASFQSCASPRLRVGYRL
jgi:hypothetical protein